MQPQRGRPGGDPQESPPPCAWSEDCTANTRTHPLSVDLAECRWCSPAGDMLDELS